MSNSLCRVNTIGHTLLFFAGTVFLGCAGVKNSPYNNPPGVIEMSIYPSVYDSPPEQVELTITNNSQQTAYYGENYTVEKMADGRWTEFDRAESSVTTFDNEIAPGQSKIQILNFVTDKDDYSPGHYRVVKGIYLDTTGESYRTAGFEII